MGHDHRKEEDDQPQNQNSNEKERLQRLNRVTESTNGTIIIPSLHPQTDRQSQRVKESHACCPHVSKSLGASSATSAKDVFRLFATTRALVSPPKKHTLHITLSHLLRFLVPLGLLLLRSSAVGLSELAHCSLDVVVIAADPFFSPSSSSLQVVKQPPQCLRPLLDFWPL